MHPYLTHLGGSLEKLEGGKRGGGEDLVFRVGKGKEKNFQT